MCRAAATSGENPRSSNTFRSLRTFLLLIFTKRLVFSGFHVLETILGQVYVLLRSLIRRFLKCMQNINPTSVQIVHEAVPEVFVLVSQFANTGQHLAHWLAI